MDAGLSFQEYDMQYLYLIKCQQYYKIGVANDVESRLAQLSTGNPFPLEVETIYEFENAEIVERAVHQKLKSKRVRGEWFELTYDDTVELHKVCLILGGSAFEYTGENPDEVTIEEAESVSEPVDGAKWDYAAMFTDGWVMEKASDGKGRANYWNWRKRREGKYIYGGRLIDLPYPDLEEMRRVYRDKTTQEPHEAETK